MPRIIRPEQPAGAAARIDLEVAISPLVVLGRAPSPVSSERGTTCADLPPASDPMLVARAAAAKQALEDDIVILGITTRSKK